MKKFMVRCDMEGVTGVVVGEQAEPGHSAYGWGLRMFNEELLALLAGLREGGADQVVVYDEHYYGTNVDLAALPEYASVIAGKPPYREDWAGGLDASFAGVVLLGFHAKAGTPGACLSHTYEPDIVEIVLNGKSVGEIGVEAAIAGDWGVAVVMVVADSSGVAEARALLPEVVGVSVKESLPGGGALCHPLCVTRSAIRTAAALVAGSAPPVKPYRLQAPVTLEVRLREGAYRDAVGKLFASRMSAADRLRLTGDTATAVWAEYWQKKLQAQEVCGRASSEDNP
ncbi:MAG: M55 family metallopeptidase [Planctomycetota bacterium]